MKVEVAAVCRSKTMVLLEPGSDGGLKGGAWPAGEVPVDLEKLGDHVLAAAKASGGKALVVDNTASDAPAEMYEKWLSEADKLFCVLICSCVLTGGTF